MCHSKITPLLLFVFLAYVKWINTFPFPGKGPGGIEASKHVTRILPALALYQLCSHFCYRCEYEDEKNECIEICKALQRNLGLPLRKNISHHIKLELCSFCRIPNCLKEEAMLTPKPAGYNKFA